MYNKLRETLELTDIFLLRHLDQISSLVNFDEANWEVDVLDNWLPKYVFSYFDATGESGCWERKPTRKIDGRTAAEGNGWKYSTHLLYGHSDGYMLRSAGQRTINPEGSRAVWDRRIEGRGIPSIPSQNSEQDCRSTMSDGGRLGNKVVPGQCWKKAPETKLGKTPLSNGLEAASFN